MVDATYIKVRENHRIVSKVLMVAIGLTDGGLKEIIGISLLTQRPRRAGLPLSDHSPHVDDAMTVMEPPISMPKVCTYLKLPWET